MNLTISGHHLEVTPAIRDYVSEKLDRVKRHFDHVINLTVIMQVEKLVHKVEATLHVKGHDFNAHSEDGNMYAAIDLLADKLDRQIVIEGAVVQRMGDSVLGSQYAIGARYQHPISNAWIVRLDVMHGWRQGLEDIYGARLELRRKL